MTKDQKIIEDSERNNIPIFVFTAKDKLALAAIRTYHMDCITAKTSQEHCNAVMERYKGFKEWQKKNKKLVKLPD